MKIQSNNFETKYHMKEEILEYVVAQEPNKTDKK